jgi:hypothetical protein
MLDVRFRPREKWSEPRKLQHRNGQFKMPFLQADKFYLERIVREVDIAWRGEYN